jgi:hypothetical protein
MLVANCGQGKTQSTREQPSNGHQGLNPARIEPRPKDDAEQADQPGAPSIIRAVTRSRLMK